jgi:chemotaxis-related protein WspD
MSTDRQVFASAPDVGVHDCWTTVGVRGDGSCAELERYVHCRNCPVYSAGAMRVLDAEIAAADTAKWTAHVSQPKTAQAPDTRAVVLFRLGVEWLGLAAGAVSEVTDLMVVHSLPHRRNSVVLGLTNLRGELVVCASLASLLGLPTDDGPPAHERHRRKQRLLVLRHEQVRAVCPVDEVHGIHRFSPAQLQEVPTTVASAPQTYSRAILPWQARSVGVLDEALLMGALKRSLA